MPYYHFLNYYNVVFFINFLTMLINLSNYAENLLIKLYMLPGTVTQNLISFQMLSSTSTSF